MEALDFDKLEARFDVMEASLINFQASDAGSASRRDHQADVQEAIQHSLVTDHGFCGVKTTGSQDRHWSIT
jgi:hypothetical protein